MRTESIAAHLTTAYRAARYQGFLTNGQMLGGNVVQASHRTLSSALARSENGNDADVQL